MMRLIASLALLFATTASGMAHDYSLDNLQIDHPWTRASLGGTKTGAVYMTVTNDGTTDARLIAAHTDLAKKVELHTNIDTDGVMKMQQVEAIEIPAGETTKIAPGGFHIMLMGLKETFKKGDSFPVTLVFDKAGKTTVEVTVEGVMSESK